MNGDTIVWILVARSHADDPHPEDGVQIPAHAVTTSREEAVRRAELIGVDAEGLPKVIVAELIDRRAGSDDGQ